MASGYKGGILEFVLLNNTQANLHSSAVVVVVVVVVFVVIIIVGHKNLTLKFGQNWVSNK